MEEEEEDDGSFIQKAKSFFKEKKVTPSGKADKHIKENLPDYIDKYELATRDDLNNVDKKIENYVEEVSEIKDWKKKTEQNLEKNKRKVNRLMKKHGVEE